VENVRGETNKHRVSDSVSFSVQKTTLLSKVHNLGTKCNTFNVTAKDFDNDVWIINTHFLD
jgi:hypothetical protein